MKVFIVLAAYLLNSAMAFGIEDVWSGLTSGWGPWSTNEPKGGRYNGLRVKYGPSAEGADSSYFFSIPRTMNEAVMARWELESTRPPGPMPFLRMFCPPGRVVCALYDDLGKIAGLQIALPVDSYEFMEPEKKFVLWNAPATRDQPDRDYWTLTQYYVIDGFNPGPSFSTDFDTLREGGVWVTVPDGSLMRIPVSEAALNSTSYTRQQCIPNMGNHYYWNMSPELKCEDLFPWFPITNKEDLIGVGFMMFGRLAPQQQRDYFEIPPTRQESPTPLIPDAPQCLWDWQEKYGMLTMHIYFVDDPWNIRCDD